MSDTNEIASTISSIIKSFPSQRILGSELSLLVKREHPGFNPLSFGCENLRRFIRQYVAEVFEAGRSGGDVVYALRTSMQPQLTFGEPPSKLPIVEEVEIPEIDRSVWKTFVSPSGAFRLFTNPDTAEFRVLSAYEPSLTNPWIQVPPCPPATHLAIARDFTETVSDEAMKSQLKQLLDKTPWWPEFYTTTHRLGLDRQWIDFRKQRLWVEFKKTLTGLGVNQALAPKELMTTSTTPRFRNTNDRSIRLIAMGVIRRLPTSELRRLRLPLGYVIDELQKH